MRLRRLIGVILFVVRIVLLVMGLREINSFSSQFSRFFAGSPTDRAIWLTIGGIAALFVGAAASRHHTLVK